MCRFVLVKWMQLKLDAIFFHSLAAASTGPTRMARAFTKTLSSYSWLHRALTVSVLGQFYMPKWHKSGIFLRKTFCGILSALGLSARSLVECSKRLHADNTQTAFVYRFAVAGKIGPTNWTQLGRENLNINAHAQLFSHLPSAGGVHPGTWHPRRLLWWRHPGQLRCGSAAWLFSIDKHRDTKEPARYVLGRAAGSGVTDMSHPAIVLVAKTHQAGVRGLPEFPVLWRKEFGQEPKIGLRCFEH